MVYYCHNCNSNVEVTETFQCQTCGGGFVEELPQVDATNVRASRNGNEPLMFQGNQLMDLLTSPDSPLAFIRSHRTAGPNTSSDSTSRSNTDIGQNEGPSRQQLNDPLTQFFNSLIANLADGGGGNPNLTNITFTFGGGDGEGQNFFQQLHSQPGDYAWGEGGLDQVVTQLLNQFEGVTQASIRPEDLDHIPMVEVSIAQAENGAQCTTCMDTFVAGTIVAKLNCEHIFHKECILPWLRRRNTCPICRAIVDPKKWKHVPNSENLPKITDIDELD